MDKSKRFKIIIKKTGKKELKEIDYDVIGEGTYGCVHKPSLKCNETLPLSFYDKKVSKIGKNKDMNKEFNEYKIIERADKTTDYYPGKPYKCDPINDETTKNAIDKCEDFEGEKIDKYKLLILNDGGKNLKDYVKNVLIDIKNDKKNKNKYKLQLDYFWLECHRLFLGIQLFLKKNIVHHDIKQQNIVYNNKIGRVNFIDFGLMDKITKIKKISNNSKYYFPNRHWSFPPETIYYNLNNYEKLTKQTKKEKIEHDYEKFLEEIKNKNSHLNLFFKETINDYNEQTGSNIIKNYTNEYYYMIIEDLTPDNYDEFLDRSISTIDSYGLAMGLIYVLNHLYELMDIKLITDLYDLFYEMLNFNVMKRIKIEDALLRYEDILERNGLLTKYNVYIDDDHIIRDNTKIYNKISKKLDNILQKSINKKSIKNTESITENDPEIICPKSMTFDEENKKCIKIKSKKFKKSKKTISSKSKTKKKTQKKDK